MIFTTRTPLGWGGYSILIPAWRKRRPKGAPRGVTECAVVLEDCLCDERLCLHAAARAVLCSGNTSGRVAAGAQREKEEPSYTRRGVGRLRTRTSLGTKTRGSAIILLYFISL
jgi:hypothetical protein